MASCITLSLGEGIPSGLSFPFFLGMYTLSDGLNWNVLSFIASITSPSAHFSDIPSKVSLSVPGVMLPGLDFKD